MLIVFILVLIVWCYVSGVVKQSRQELSQQERAKRSAANRLIVRHQEYEEAKAMERSMNEALQRLNRKNKARFNAEFSEYIAWCRSNHKPMIDVNKLKNSCL